MKTETIFRNDLVLVDIQDAETKRIKGTFSLDFLSDEIVYIKGLRGKEILSEFDSKMFYAITKQYPKLKSGMFTMEGSLLQKLSSFSDLKFEILNKTMIAGKSAYMVSVSLYEAERLRVV